MTSASEPVSASCRTLKGKPVGEASGIAAAFYFLPADPREKTPMLVNLIHLKSPFNRMRARHELWKQKFPDRPHKHGPAYTGISNARPATMALSKPPADMSKLPFDPLEFIKHLGQLPFDPGSEPDPGQWRKAGESSHLVRQRVGLCQSNARCRACLQN